MKTKFLASLCTAISLTLMACSSNRSLSPAAWVDLIEGPTLDGWVQRGGKANYYVEGNEIAGTTVPNTPNSFLCTTREYANFILELEFKVHPNLNSGVQIRSQAFDQPTEIQSNDRTIRIAAGRVHGYQIEIDPAARAWSGGLYDEGRRGWLRNLENNPAARAAFKQGEWNHFRIEAIDDSIKTWLNAVPATDFKDSMTPSGFIALQVHGVGSRTNAMEVRFRNIRIKERP